MNASPFQIACDELAELGLKLTQAPGEYRVNFNAGSPKTEYKTDDLADAVQHGQRRAPPAIHRATAEESDFAYTVGRSRNPK